MFAELVLAVLLLLVLSLICSLALVRLAPFILVTHVSLHNLSRLFLTLIPPNYYYVGSTNYLCGGFIGYGESVYFVSQSASIPLNSTCVGSVCTCTDPYVPDPTKTSCVPVSTCTVPELTPLPAGDECAKSLDDGLGVDINHKCPPLDDRLPGQIQCFANKIATTNVTARPPIPYSGPTAQYRNAAYQAHLRDIWDTMIELNKPDNKNNEACQPLRDKVIAEKGCDSNEGCPDVCAPGSHCIRNIPATSSNHTQGTAFDVSKDTIKWLFDYLTPRPPAPMTPQQKIQAQRIWVVNWLASPTACNLYWGGNFTNPGPDYVHFQLP
jgi:hypothetical protein